MVNIIAFSEARKRAKLEGKKDPQPEWIPFCPNPATSVPIQKDMFYGRAIRVPGERVFVISGSIHQTNTNELTDQVQEWNLFDMTVRLVQPIPEARTSFGAYLHERFIYVIGGNLQKSKSTNKVCRFDIYKRSWQLLPSMIEHRANAGSMIIDNFLYAFGGF